MSVPLFLDVTLADNEDEAIELHTAAGHLRAVHIFDAPSIHAVNAALASGRPLLLRGEPGVGKSQLAHAAAKVLRRPFLSYAVDIQTESQDLLWRFDSVSRLAEAQVAGAFASCSGEHLPNVLQKHREAMRVEMAIKHFMHPGPLWWAFDWENAEGQAERARGNVPSYDEDAAPANGCVLLIDEIDKAETDVPNGLLEALGAGQFTPFGRIEPVFVGEIPPLVIITTNEERALPDAFLRRCMVLNMELPRDEEGLTTLLIKRGAKHFPEVHQDVLKEAAKQLWDDREVTRQEGLHPLPGQAEYMDLLRALHNRYPGDTEQQDKLLNQISAFALRKHRKST
jgi:MoxR-like ATPase